MTFEQGPCNTDTIVINCQVPISFKDADGINECCPWLTVLQCCPVVLRENFCRDEATDDGKGAWEDVKKRNILNIDLMRNWESTASPEAYFYLTNSPKALKLRWSAFFFLLTFTLICKSFFTLDNVFCWSGFVSSAPLVTSLRLMVRAEATPFFLSAVLTNDQRHTYPGTFFVKRVKLNHSSAHYYKLCSCFCPLEKSRISTDSKFKMLSVAAARQTDRHSLCLQQPSVTLGYSISL